MSVDDLLARVREDLDAARSEPIERLSPQALLWSAVIPEWSLELAARAGFPTPDDQPVDEWLALAVEMQICRRAPAQAIGGDRTDRFWMTSTARSTVLPAVVSTLGPRWTASLEAMASALEPLVDDPGSLSAPGLRPTIELARLSPAAAAQRVLMEVRRSVDAGDLHTTNAWLVAADRLGEVYGIEVESAVRRARRLVALTHRRRHDEVVRRDYIERPDLIAPFTRLLSSEDIWALHYLGDGGVGKTSLLRMLTRYGSDAEDLLFARIDFDHVSPDYPWRRPAQLLSLLADELESTAVTADQERTLDAFRRYERRSGHVARASASTASLDEADFSRALDGFADLLTALPGRTVIVLDTCEELAKYHAPGEPVAAVDFTFGILERLHARVPSFRVVFAGRRLLARSGADTAGWRTLRRDRGRAPATGREYLDLCVVEGFRREEASAFLVEKKQIPRPGPLHDAILEATGEVDADPDEIRHNPFDVAMYASWVADEPTLSPDAIRDDDGSRYVEQRILGRLEPALRDAIPVLVSLRGRATRELLTLALGSERRADAVYERLRLQEWIDPQATWAGEELAVQPRLQRRLERYVQSADAPSVRTVTRAADARLRAGLASFLRERPSRLAPTTAAVALALASEDEALTAWTSLEDAAAEFDEWNELLRLAGHLAGDAADGGLPEGRERLRRAVIETRALAIACTDAGRAALIARLAAEVYPHAGDRSTSFAPGGLDRTLAHMAIDGFAHRYRTIPEPGTRGRGRFASDLESVLDEAVRAGVPVDALSPVIDRLVVNGMDPRPELRELEAFVLALAGRWRAMTGQRRQASEQLIEAERQCRSAGEIGGDRHRPGWVRPATPLDRIRLFIVETYHEKGPVDPVEPFRRWFAEACDRSSEIDANRLASRIMIAACDAAQAGRLELDTGAVDLIGPDRWTLALHDRVPPLVGALAIDEFASGQKDSARDRLRDVKRHLSRSDEQRAVAIELVELRLAAIDGHDLGDRLVQLAGKEDGRAPLAAALLAQIDRITELPPELDVNRSPHHTWRVTRRSELVRPLIEARATSSGLDRYEVTLDLIEAERMGCVDLRGEVDPTSDIGDAVVFDAVTRERRMRCELRRSGLMRGATPPSDLRRRGAELAAEEGMLLRPVLTEPARKLLDVASAAYKAIGDDAGRARCDAALESLGDDARRVRGDAALESLGGRPGKQPFVTASRLTGAALAGTIAFTLLALAIAASVNSPTSAADSAGSGASDLVAAYIGLSLMVVGTWFGYRRRLYKGPLGIIGLPSHWPYWMSWRVRGAPWRGLPPAFVGIGGDVWLRRAQRHSGVGLTPVRWLLLIPQVYSYPFELVRTVLLLLRYPRWPGGAAVPDRYCRAVERSRDPICVELDLEYGDEPAQHERRFAEMFHLPPEASSFVFFRRSGESHHVVHPMRRTARRAGVSIVAAGALEQRIASAWRTWEGMRVREPVRLPGGGFWPHHAQVLHVVGSPVETNLGWEMEIGVPDWARSADTQEFGAVFSASNTQGTHRLVVLQPSPTLDSAGHPDDPDAAGCRFVARGLREVGNPIVVVLPAVSVEIGLRLVSEMAGIIRDRQLDRLRLMDLSVALRRSLAEQLTDLDAATRAGVVGDLTIYTDR